MSNPKEKAEELVNSYRIVLMNEDTECGNEILCTSIAKDSALIAVDEIMKVIGWEGMEIRLIEIIIGKKLKKKLNYYE
jgi:uncharacterized protein (UPF0212 family)